MTEATREFVRRRALNRCEYCLAPQEAFQHSTFHIEHIIARQHHGGDDPSNLALACERCNFHKGTNLGAIDPESGQVVPMFNPRSDVWNRHFALVNFRIIGLTAVGRAAVRLLQLNLQSRVDAREGLG